MPNRSTAAALAAALLATAAVLLSQNNNPATSTAPATQSSSLAAPPLDITNKLDELDVKQRPNSQSTYARARFGKAWADTDNNGCNQRDDILVRDAVPGTVQVATQGSCSHDVLAGQWVDPYTGATITLTDAKDPTQAQLVQIDHVVPLEEAWLSGANSWTDEQRLQYANDLATLLAVDGPSNASKGSDDPAAWRPTKHYQCAYAQQWITVKHTYGLAVDEPEKAALLDMLTLCPAT